MRIIAFISFLLLFTFNVNIIYAKKAAIVIDYETQKVLFEINADTLNYPASLTKMMTIYVVFDYLENKKIFWDTKMIVSENASKQQPSKLHLEKGSFILVEDAINALIIKSANDVATVVAEHISGTERNFSKLMNQYAKKIGMKKTTFKNASGLPNRAQMTTARDMSILSHALINNFPNYYNLFSKKKFVWKGKTYRSHNKLLKKYEGADGLKTGYIRASGFQLAFSAVRKNKRLIGIYFGGDSGKQRDQRLTIIMNKAFKDLNLGSLQASNNNKNKISNNSKNLTKNKFKIVVGTFRYKKNAQTQLNLISKKYPKTTKNKEGIIVRIKNGSGYLYETQFKFFSKNEASKACKRLMKYKRDCFVRG